MRLPLRKKAPVRKTRGVRRVVTDQNPVVEPPKKKFKLPEIDLKKFRAPVGGLLFVFLLAFGTYKGYQYLYTGDHFKLRHMKISHTPQLDRKTLINQTGLKYGINIFKIKPGKIRQKLLDHPWIKEASVYRQLPDTIVINVIEENAVCAAMFQDDKNSEALFYLVNPEGKVFKKAEKSKLKGKYIITGFTREEFGKNPHGIQRRLKKVITMMDAYGSNNARPAVSEVFLQFDTASLYLKDSTTSIQVDTENFRSQFMMLDQFLANVEVALKDIQKIYLDNRESPNRVVIIPVKKQPATDENGASDNKALAQNKLKNEKSGKASSKKKKSANHKIAKSLKKSKNDKKHRSSVGFSKKSNNQLSSNR